jgi:antitoxin component of RelBE/YafQ-DinJ toxin-antitoxin module
MKNYSIGARVDEKEYRALSMIAAHQNLSPSAALRWLIHQECERRGMPPGLVQFYDKLPALVSLEVPHGNE